MHQAGTRAAPLNIAEQALTLLDILPSILQRKRLDNFTNLDLVIDDSISPVPFADPVDATPGATPYAVAARMGRSNYEEHAKAEALATALRQMRGRHAQSARVIRGS